MKDIKEYLVNEGGGYQLDGIDRFFTDGIGKFSKDEWNDEINNCKKLFDKSPKEAIDHIILDIYDKFKYPDEIFKFLGSIYHNQE